MCNSQCCSFVRIVIRFKLRERKDLLKFNSLTQVRYFTCTSDIIDYFFCIFFELFGTIGKSWSYRYEHKEIFFAYGSSGWICFARIADVVAGVRRPLGMLKYLRKSLFPIMVKYQCMVLQLRQYTIYSKIQYKS